MPNDLSAEAKFSSASYWMPTLPSGHTTSFSPANTTRLGEIWFADPEMSMPSSVRAMTQPWCGIS